MNLQTGKFYWPTTLANIPNYPKLDESIECDVLIIGAGSSGAQCAHYLSDLDLNIVIVDKRKAGQGSTITNTALLQYAGDKMFTDLINSFGEGNATRHLKLCQEAMSEIEAVSKTLEIDPEFSRKDTLYYASYNEDVPKLKKEFHYLQKHGFEADYFSEDDIGKRYPFKKKSAIYFKNDAVINPYRFTIGLLEKARAKGVRIYEETEITGKRFDSDKATFYTGDRQEIKAKYVIVAAGYEGLEFKAEKNATMVSSYAIVTNQIDDLSFWYKQTLIWETARPYIYMRTTPDNRIIIGGLDENTPYVDDRDSKLLHKKQKLIKEFNKLFPDINVTPEYYLAAFYGGTHDGLPMIGMYDEFPNTFFLFGYGDNGTVYSMVLAKIINNIISKGDSSNLDLYLQTRPFIRKA